MKLITKRDVIRSVADRWLAAFSKRIDEGGEHSAILARLRTLDLETASEADVGLVIGGSGWCELKCAECHEPADQVALFQAFCELDFMRVLSGTYVRDPDDPESWPRELRVCGPCVFKAFKLLEQYR